MTDLHRWKRRLARARVVVYAALVLLVVYGVWRYDIVRLPAEGCSPLRGYEPGDRILIERVESPQEGDLVLYAAEGELYLGRVDAPPPSAPTEAWDAWQAGALWLVAERADCPSRDSRVLGAIPRSAIRGRIVVGLPW